jgi:tetratricopeptide (TPR) repeat protein
MSDRRFDLLARVLLLSAVLLVYAQVRTHEFLNYDDDEYVTDNGYVLHGLTATGARWAFTGIHSASWHPLTTLSHMLDVELFGLDAGAHLTVNVVLHALASLLLYELLRRGSGARGPSAFVAALFALHPLRVESVAWVSERKDVLSAFLGFAALLAYLRYARAPSRRRYALVAVLFALGLLAKPMLVTLPFALLLLDFWPLGRAREIRPDGCAVGFSPRRISALALEKAPLLVLAVAASAVTFLVQRSAGAVVSVDALPIGLRIENALVSYVSYVIATAWPAGLAVFYPLHPPIATLRVAASVVCLASITAAALWSWRRRPYLSTGWLWYLGTLVPVIGLVRVGDQAMADRYTYLPSIGLYVMIAWGARDLLGSRSRVPLAAAAALAIAGCAALTWVQLGHWRNSETLFRHALAVTSGNYVAHTNLGAVLLARGETDAALAHFEAALRIRDTDAVAHTKLGDALMKRGRTQEALPHFEQVLRSGPHAEAHVNIGIALAERGDDEGAAAHYAAALRTDPDNALAQFNWGALLARQGDEEGAIARYREAVRLDPDYAKAHNNLGLALAGRGRFAEAIEHYRAALGADPRLGAAYGNLGVALESSGDAPGALEAYRELVQREPNDPRARYNLAALLADLGRSGEAAEQYRQALRLQPGWAPAMEALARIGGTAAPEKPPDGE